MGASRVSEDIDHPRRGFIGAAAITLAAARFGMSDSANAQTAAPDLPAIKLETNTTFAPLKQIDAGLLNVGYAEAGPADGPPVLLLGEVPPWFRGAQERTGQPTRLIREQAFGESLDADKLERLGRYEAHLDRKLERMLAMLLRLKDLRQGAIAG
jgi:hypothetical protein